MASDMTVKVAHHWSDALPPDTCREALVWARAQPSYAKAWRACRRGDWLLWLAARVGVDRRLIVLAACDCARLSLRYVPAGDDRSRVAIETAERWARGEATIEEVRAAAAAAYAAYAAYAADAAYASADAAYAASAAVASAASAASAASNACAQTFARCATLVRRRIPRPGLGPLSRKQAAEAAGKAERPGQARRT